MVQLGKPEKFGRFRLLHRIAVGGMAEIFIACDPSAPLAEQLLVIKRIRRDLYQDPMFVEMFLDEARVIQRLAHPNIVRMRDSGQIDELYYLALEFVWGESLAVLLLLCEVQRVQFPVGAALYVAAEIAQALHHAHQLLGSDFEPAPIIHRDVTLSNVVISYQGEVKLLDFGIAKAKDRLANTKVGAVKGTLVYLAPEQVLAEEVGPHTDIYQLGVLLYKTLVGREPIVCDTEAQLVNAIAAGRITPPSTVIPGFPERVETVILKALARRPQDRFDSAIALRAALLGLVGPHHVLGQRRLSKLVMSIARDRFKRQAHMVNALLRGIRAEQGQEEYVGWAAPTEEPRKVCVELSNVTPMPTPQVAIGQQPYPDQAEIPTKPTVLAAAGPAVVNEPGPSVRVDPRIQAALTQAFAQPTDEVLPMLAELLGQELAPAKPAEPGATQPPLPPTQDFENMRTDVDPEVPVVLGSELGTAEFANAPTVIDEMSFPDAPTLLGWEREAAPPPDPDDFAHDAPTVRIGPDVIAPADPRFVDEGPTKLLDEELADDAADEFDHEGPTVRVAQAALAVPSAGITDEAATKQLDDEPAPATSGRFADEGPTKLLDD